GSGLTVATLPRTASGDGITSPPATNSLSFPFSGRSTFANVTVPSLNGNSTVAPVPVRMWRRSTAFWGMLGQRRIGPATVAELDRSFLLQIAGDVEVEGRGPRQAAQDVCGDQREQV